MTIAPKPIQKEFTPANNDTTQPLGQHGDRRTVPTNSGFNAATTDIIRTSLRGNR